MTNTNIPNNNSATKLWLGIALILLVFIWNKDNWFSDPTWAVDKACIEVKSDVYQMHGIIPQVSGELLFQNEPHYIVAVNYKIPERNWTGSFACYIYGYGKDNCHLSGMCNEMRYDYNYKSELDELKALWALE